MNREDSGSSDLDDVLDALNDPALRVWEDVERHPTEWTIDQAGVTRGRKTVAVPGIGNLGVISFECTITRKGAGHECRIEALCLPLSQTTTAFASSVDDAKGVVERTWGCQAGVIVSLQDSVSAVPKRSVRKRWWQVWR